MALLQLSVRLRAQSHHSNNMNHSSNKQHTKPHPSIRPLPSALPAAQKPQETPTRRPSNGPRNNSLHSRPNSNNPRRLHTYEPDPPRQTRLLDKQRHRRPNLWLKANRRLRTALLRHAMGLQSLPPTPLLQPDNRSPPALRSEASSSLHLHGLPSDANPLLRSLVPSLQRLLVRPGLLAAMLDLPAPPNHKLRRERLKRHPNPAHPPPSARQNPTAPPEKTRALRRFQRRYLRYPICRAE